MDHTGAKGQAGSGAGETGHRQLPAGSSGGNGFLLPQQTVCFLQTGVAELLSQYTQFPSDLFPHPALQFARPFFPAGRAGEQKVL